ncbi:hypothetical protein POTOM_011038 [Populus tomentosa]|uniref:DNA mismatch repair protein MutS core domain-containing protein n=1 Tax=Populus tomentosa TaxID=118781 RepID=A0A8X8A937_POPTO|nr:hypothetical protein POTOM_011038 [Populus tomentosa]
MLSSETERVMVRHTRNPLVNELAPLSEFWDAEKTIQEVKTIYKHIGDLSASGPLNKTDKTDLDTTNLNVGEYRPSCLPSILSEFYESLALSALGGALYYLKQLFLDETLLRFAKFDSLPCSDFCEVAKKPYMILDDAALENLEIFENSRNGDTSGMLYAQLNHCVTEFGKRLLKTWLARPLYHLESVKDRRDAVAGLRLTKKQLQEFISALRGCELVAQACSSLAVILENVESGRLHHLLTPGKDLPGILPILKHFKSAFDWAEANNSGRIIPHEGVHVEYDSACEKITYVTVGKEAYLLEVPEHLRGSIPQDYEPRSSKKGFYRYWTPSIKKFLGGLSQVESEKESALNSILQRSDSLEKGAFVPNDISIGGSGCAGFILLSGPNIGGKSTFFRQVCLAVILAQNGCKRSYYGRLEYIFDRAFRNCIGAGEFSW